MRAPAAALLAALALAAACAEPKSRPTDYGAPAVLSVEGWTSWADGKKADVLQDAALADARREALGKALRAELSAALLSEHSEEISAKILADPLRCIVSERILDSGRQGAYYKVRAEEGVLFAKVAEDLRELGLLAKSGKSAAAVGLSIAGPAGAQEELTRLLAGQGLDIVDLSSRSFVSGSEISISSAAAYTRARGLRTVAAGWVELFSDPGLKTKDFQSSEARLRLWVIDAARGTVLAVSDQKATGSGPSEEISSGKAVSAAAQAAAPETALALGKSTAQSESILLKIANAGAPEDLQRLMQWLRSRSEIQDPVIEEYSGTSVNVSLRALKLSPDELAALMLRQPGVKYDIRSVLPNAVELDRK